MAEIIGAKSTHVNWERYYSHRTPLQDLACSAPELLKRPRSANLSFCPDLTISRSRYVPCRCIRVYRRPSGSKLVITRPGAHAYAGRPHREEVGHAGEQRTSWLPLAPLPPRPRRRIDADIPRRLFLRHPGRNPAPHELLAKRLFLRQRVVTEKRDDRRLVLEVRLRPTRPAWGAVAAA